MHIRFGAMSVGCCALRSCSGLTVAVRSGPGNSPQAAPLMAVPVFGNSRHSDQQCRRGAIHCAQIPRTRRKTSLGAHRTHKECLPMNVVLQQSQTHRSSPVAPIPAREASKNTGLRRGDRSTGGLTLHIRFGAMPVGYCALRSCSGLTSRSDGRCPDLVLVTVLTRRL